MYDKTRELIESEKSKFIFTGQQSKDPNTKLVHFGFVSLLAMGTVGIWLAILATTKKPVYHGTVFLRDGPNPITDDVLKRLKKKVNLDINGLAETIELVVDTGANNFIIATDDRVYFQVNPDAKVLSGHNLVNKDVAISEVESLTVKSHMSEYLSIKLNDEYFGALAGGGFPRVEKLMQTFAKDLTS